MLAGGSHMSDEEQVTEEPSDLNAHRATGGTDGVVADEEGDDGRPIAGGGVRVHTPQSARLRPRHPNASPSTLDDCRHDSAVLCHR